MAETETRTRTIPFQAETKELLRLVVHSLYRRREIFLRELISNASDALDKLRFEALRDPELWEGDEALQIELRPDPDARTLAVVDTGVGMTHEEVVENLGTIARSGTRGFLDRLREADEGGADLPELIGRFGVGFYSAFMVAEEVVVETRRAGAAKGVRWTSRGEGEFSVEEIDRAERGTSVLLRLRPSGEDDDGPDFTDERVLRALVRRYSDFVAYPIRMEVEREEGEGDERETVRRTETLNSQRPIWTRPKEEVEEREYAEFYKHLAHDWTDPLDTIHLRAEGATEFTALLYVPRTRPIDLFDPTRRGARLHLHVRRVFVMDDCEELLPPWLRFVRGVVDASDLPLNVSRETLQDDRQVRRIRARLTRKVLDALRAMQRDRREDYVAFWRAFGPVVKEGVWADDEHRDELAELLLVDTTAGDEPATLAEVVERMPVGQEAIWVLPGQDVEAARRSPHLEALRSKGQEVLLLGDPVDELVLERLTSFRDKPLRRVDQGDVELGDEEGRERRAARAKELGALLELVRKELAEHVEEVRLSSRLTDSPAVLVSGAHGPSPQLERMLREAGQPVPERKRVLELNPDHPLVGRMRDLAADDASYPRFAEACELVHGLALLAEGSPLADPVRFSRLVAERMVGDAGAAAPEDAPPR